MNRQEKEQFIAELREDLANAGSVVVASATGIAVNDLNEMRSKLRATGGKYRVVKNTLAKLAIAGTEMEVLGELLKGETAIAYAPEDPVSPAKGLADFAKDHDKFVIKGGYLNGSLLDAAAVAQLAKMPGKDELRSKLLSVMQGVPTKMVRTLAAAPQNFLLVLSARKNEI